MYKYKVTLERTIYQVSDEFEIEVPKIDYEVIKAEALRHAGAVDWEGDPEPATLATMELIEEEKIP